MSEPYNRKMIELVKNCRSRKIDLKEGVYVALSESLLKRLQNMEW
jgi:hypothetical protein